MFLTEESVKDVIAAAIQATGHQSGIADTIKETVDALIAADRVLLAHISEQEGFTSESR